MSAFEFSQDRLTRFKNLVAKYERPQCALLPTLYLVQEQQGYISAESIEYVAGLLDMPPNHVADAASFYTMFYKKPMGKWCLQVCDNITCTMMGSETVLAKAKSLLGIDLKETTSDGLFSLLRVECLGACDQAPVLQVNEDYHHRVNEDTLGKLIENLRANNA